jgi:FAD/FMN-containing dehydrogenase
MPQHGEQTSAGALSGDADAARASYGAETYAKLVGLKNEYDPTNVFRLNQNIEPAAA